MGPKLLLPLLLFALLADLSPAVDLSDGLGDLWQRDSSNRATFRREFKIEEGALKALSKGGGGGGLLDRPIVASFKRLCNTFRSLQSNEPKSRLSLNSARDQFLERLNTSRIFKRAAQLFADSSSQGKQFASEVRSLWFSPVEPSPFDTLLCRFSARTGTWLSLILGQQSQVEVQQLETENGEVNSREFATVRFGVDGRLQERLIPLGTSIEFDLSAITLCALLNAAEGQKNCSIPFGEGREVLELRIEGGGNRNRLEGFHYSKRGTPSRSAEEQFPALQSASPSSSSSSRRWETVRRNGGGGAGSRLSHSQSLPNLAPPRNLQQLVEQLWAQDVDRVDESVVRVDWQQHIPSRSVQDVSPRPFISVTNDTFMQRPIYAALIRIYNEQLLHPPVCEGEPPMDAQRRAKFDTFWRAVAQSDVFRTAYDYLDSLGKTGGDFGAFTSELFDRWFGAYTRCKTCESNGGRCRRGGPLGSSGWEHVFSGEWRGDLVDGHHNWVRYYMQQQRGAIEYHGYFVKPRNGGNFIGTIQYKWERYVKKLGGFLIRTSPAFDFSLFTVCALSEPGDEACQFELNGTPMFVSSFMEGCTVQGQFRRQFCISTTYPGIRRSQEH